MNSLVMRLRRTLVAPVVETVFPSRCWVTDVPISSGDMGLAPDVRRQIAEGIEFPYCARCGMNTGPYTANDRRNRCGQCDQRNLGVATIARVGVFAEPLSTLVKHIKFRKLWELAGLVAPFMVQAIEQQAHRQRTPVDALVPVALHWRRRYSRGFNQAEEIAIAMSRLKGWPVLHALRRVRATVEQSHAQSVTARRENLDRAFEAKMKVDVAGKHIWLIDDVCTTGATIHAAAVAFKRLPKELRPAGIHAAVVCATDRTPIPFTPS